KEVKRFVLLIVVPASILIFLLVANPFTPKNNIIQPPPVVAKLPSPPAPVPTNQASPKPPKVVAPKPVVPKPVVPKPTPKKMAAPKAVPPVEAKPVEAKDPDNILMMTPGMREVLIDELNAPVIQTQPIPQKQKPVARVELKEPPDSPPAPIILAPEPPVERKKIVTPTPKPRRETPPPVREKTTKAVEPKNPGKSENQVAALVPPQKGGTFPYMPESDIFKNGDYYFNRAIFFQQSRDWENALTNYAQAAKHNPENPDIYNNMGVIHKELRQYNRAIEEFLKAVYLKPDYAKPYNNIGVVYFAKEDYLTAIQNYKKAISIDPKNLEALNNLSVAYKKLGQLEKAKSVLNQALKLGENHAGTHYNLAVLHEETGNMESAIHFYQKFTKLGITSHPGLVRKVEKHIKTLR
ncbi:MAG: tetratricopeptide repeat protein, partial [Nitrospinae bacterium]|nr:tetratricopeptide repeat protein [Nitrospinota bacterium]